MSDYTLSQIYPSDTATMEKLETLLNANGICLDNNIDYTCGLFDDDGHIVATGSTFKNSIRCVAIDANHRGESLMNEVISHLMTHQFESGYYHIFVYTKPDAGKFFEDLGFYKIVNVPNLLAFLENKKGAFQRYLKNLERETSEQLEVLNTEGTNLKPDVSTSNIESANTSTSSLSIASIVMNATPFTKGHQQLVEAASKAHDLVHLFIVSEDVSIFPFAVRQDLVRKGTAHLPNIIYHQSGPYIISSATFPSYFQKSPESVTNSQVELDLTIFTSIAKKLHITHRYIGTEPFSQVTSTYNDQMIELLPQQGIMCHRINRYEAENGQTISASTVRQLLKDGHYDELSQFVPPSTLEFLQSPEATPIIEACKAAHTVIHH